MRLLVWGRKGLLSVLFLALLVSLVVTAMPADRADVDQDGHGHGGVPETQGWSDIVGQMLPFDFIADPSQTEQPQQQTGKRNAGNNPSTQKRKKTKTEAHPADPLTPYWNDKHEEVQLQLIQLELNRLQSTEGLTFAAFVHAVCGPLHKMKDEPFDYNDPKTPLLFEYRSLLENAFTNHLSTFGMLDEPTLDHSAGTSGSHLLPTISSHIARIRKYFDEVDLVYVAWHSLSKERSKAINEILENALMFIYLKHTIAKGAKSDIYDHGKFQNPSKANDELRWTQDALSSMLLDPPNIDLLTRIRNFVEPLAPFDSSAKDIFAMVQSSTSELSDDDTGSHLILRDSDFSWATPPFSMEELVAALRRYIVEKKNSRAPARVPPLFNWQLGLRYKNDPLGTFGKWTNEHQFGRRLYRSIDKIIPISFVEAIKRFNSFFATEFGNELTGLPIRPMKGHAFFDPFLFHRCRQFRDLFPGSLPTAMPTVPTIESEDPENRNDQISAPEEHRGIPSSHRGVPSPGTVRPKKRNRDNEKSDRQVAEPSLFRMRIHRLSKTWIHASRPGDPSTSMSLKEFVDQLYTPLRTYLNEVLKKKGSTSAYRKSKTERLPSLINFHNAFKDILQSDKADKPAAWASSAMTPEYKAFLEAYVAEIQNLYDAWYLIGHTLLKDRVAVMDTIIISLYSCLLVFEPTASRRSLIVGVPGEAIQKGKEKAPKTLNKRVLPSGLRENAITCSHYFTDLLTARLSSGPFVPPKYPPTHPPTTPAIDSLKDLLPKIQEFIEPLVPYDETAQSISGILRPLYSELQRGELDLLLLDQKALAWATIKSIYRRQELVGLGYDYDLRKKVNLEPSHAPVTTLVNLAYVSADPHDDGYKLARPLPDFRPYGAAVDRFNKFIESQRRRISLDSLPISHVEPNGFDSDLFHDSTLFGGKRDVPLQDLATIQTHSPAVPGGVAPTLEDIANHAQSVSVPSVPKNVAGYPPLHGPFHI